MTGGTWGPQTARIEQRLARLESFTDQTLDAFEQALDTMDANRPLRPRMPRSFAWLAFDRAVEHHQCRDQFDELWTRCLRNETDPLIIAEAICALMLEHLIDQGPLTRDDYDALQAPWRAVIDHCPRSRGYIAVAAGILAPPSQVWPIVDAILATPPSTAGQPPHHTSSGGRLPKPQPTDTGAPRRARR